MFQPQQHFLGFLVILAAILVISAAVIWLVVNHPDKVVIGEHYRYRLEMARFGQKDHPVTIDAVEVLPGTMAPATQTRGALPPDSDQ
jgi:hypothetical protein